MLYDMAVTTCSMVVTLPIMFYILSYVEIVEEEK